MSRIFAPPSDDELYADNDLAFAPPSEQETYASNDEDLVGKLVGHDSILDKEQKIPDDLQRTLSTINQPNLPPKSGEPGFWDKLKSYMDSASMGAMEGATANKAAEISSFVTNAMSNQNTDTTNDVQAFIDASHEKNPWTFRGGELLGMVAGAPVWGSGKLGMAAYGATAGAEGDSGLEKALGGAIGGITGTALANVIPAVASKAAPYIAKGAGYLGQLGQRVEEGAIEPLGTVFKNLPYISNFLNKGKYSAPASSLFSDSAKVKALKSIEDTATLSKLGGKTADVVKETEQEVLKKLSDDKSVGGKLTSTISDLLGNETLNRNYASLSDPEKAVVMAALARGFQKRGLNPDPVVLKNVFEDMANGVGMDLEKSSIKDVIRTMNRRDPAWASAAFKNVSDFFNPLLEKSGNITPEYYEAQMANEQLNKLVKSGAINRMMQVGGERSTYQSPLSEVAKYSEDASNLYPSTGRFSGNTTAEATNAATPMAIEKQAEAEKKSLADKSPWLGDLDRDMIRKWTGVEVNDAEGLQQAGAIAASRLGNINAGKSAVNMISGLAGGFSMYSHNPMFSLKGMIPQAISWAGKAGQMAESWGNEALINPSILANSMIKNPSVVKMMAQAPGKIGQIGQQLDQEFQKSGLEGLKSKAFVLMNTATFREAIMDYINSQQPHRPFKRGYFAESNPGIDTDTDRLDRSHPEYTW